jgi:hypothetical protein
MNNRDNQINLTPDILGVILLPVAHIGGTGLASRTLRRVSNAALCGFFVRAVLLSCYDRVSETTARWASPKTGTPISLYPVAHNWRCWRQVYNLLLRTTIMHKPQDNYAQNSGPIRPIIPLTLCSTHAEAYNALIDAFDNGLKKSFDLLIRDLEPMEISPVDCVCVLMDCERLIERLKVFKALTAEVENFGGEA